MAVDGDFLQPCPAKFPGQFLGQAIQIGGQQGGADVAAEGCPQFVAEVVEAAVMLEELEQRFRAE